MPFALISGFKASLLFIICVIAVSNEIIDAIVISRIGIRLGNNHMEVGIAMMLVIQHALDSVLSYLGSMVLGGYTPSSTLDFLTLCRYGLVVAVLFFCGAMYYFKKGGFIHKVRDETEKAELIEQGLVSGETQNEGGDDGNGAQQMLRELSPR